MNADETITLEEQKQVAIDYYVNLLRIKAAQTGENLELERQLQIANLKLSLFNMDIEELDNIFS